MPLYDYGCTECGETFEKRLSMNLVDEPCGEPCPSCGLEDVIVNYLPSAPGIGDPIKLGLQRPPDAFLHGVLGRMANSVPDGGVEMTSDGHIKLGSDGRPIKKYVNFNKARFQPGRLV